MTLSRGKLKKHIIMLESPKLATALPHTKKWNKNNLIDMLGKYGKIVIKPNYSWGGAGVIAVTPIGQGNYEIHSGNQKIIKTGVQSVYNNVVNRSKKSKLIIQRKIELARVNGRPFDIRVMLQKKKKSMKKKKTTWVVTGKCAKIAGPGYMITNVARSKGKVVSLSHALQKTSINAAPTQQIETEIDRIAITAAKKLQQYYHPRMIGLDVAVDRFGKVWIIEANFTPNIYLFAKLKNKKMFKRILSYQHGK